MLTRPLFASALALALLACGADVDLGGAVDASAFDAKAGDCSDSDSCGPRASDGAPVERCGPLDAPPLASQCKACERDASDCQPNGCYGGYWCDSAKSDCVAPPKTCN